MKKISALILVMVMAFTLAACKSQEDASTNDENNGIVSNKTDNKVENSDDKKDNTTEDETVNDDENKEDNTDVEQDTDSSNKTDSKNEDKNDNETGNKPSEDKPAENKPIENKPTENQSGKTLGNKLLDEFKAVSGSGNALSVAEKLSAYSELSVLPMGAMEIEPGLLAGFDNTEITGFKEGATFAPMMGTIPFVGYVFTLEDGADVSAFISTLTSNANRRWNICTEAEETITGSSGNKVFFVMCNKSLEN